MLLAAVAVATTVAERLLRLLRLRLRLTRKFSPFLSKVPNDDDPRVVVVPNTLDARARGTSRDVETPHLLKVHEAIDIIVCEL